MEHTRSTEPSNPLDVVTSVLNPFDFKDNKQTAQIIGVKPGTFEVWRYQGKGPRFHKIGRLVRYAMSDIKVFINGNRRMSTSDNGQI